MPIWGCGTPKFGVWGPNLVYEVAMLVYQVAIWVYGSSNLVYGGSILVRMAVPIRVYVGLNLGA